MKAILLSMALINAVQVDGLHDTQKDNAVLQAVSNIVHSGEVYTIFDMMEKWGLTLKQAESIDFDLLDQDSVDSVGGFNPFSVEKEHFSWLTKEEKYKFLRYRRAELGVCFEDEVYNKETKTCEVKK